MSPVSLSIQDLPCPERMFIASLCVTDGDLETLGLLALASACCVSRDTAARSLLHRLCREEDDVARSVNDLLDLRHLATVTQVRALDPADLDPEARVQGTASRGDELAAWAWALLTDPRDDVNRLGRRLMGECYVRGMRHLSAADATPTSSARSPG